MKIKISFTDNNLAEIDNKIICHLEDDQLFLSNIN